MKRFDLRLIRLIKNAKGQFIAITLLVICGLSIYTALSMAIVNLEDTVTYYYDETNYGDIYVQLVQIPETALDKVKGIDGVSEVEGRIVLDVPLKVDADEKVNVRVVSVDGKNSTINSLYSISGSLIDNTTKDVLVLRQFADARNINEGDIITPQIEGRTYNLEVKGIVASPEYVYLMENEQSLLPNPDKFGVIYVSEDFAQRSFGLNDSFNELVITVKDEKELDNIIDRLEKQLDQYGIKRIYDREEQLSNRMLQEEIKGVKASSQTVPVIFLGVASVIIAAMLSRMVRNDRMAIGVMKALGYRNIDIILHYTKFSVIIGIIGSVIGSSLGIIMSGYMADTYIQFFSIPMLKFKFYYTYFITSILLSVVFCIGAGLWGAKRVLKIHPAESMRPEAPKAGGRILLDRVSIIWNKLTFSWKMVIRNIFRNKKRFVFITLGIALTFAINIFPGAVLDSTTVVFDSHYSDFQKMEYNINFSRPMNISVMNEINKIIKVERIEPKIEYPFELVHGNRKKVVNIVGLDKDTEFYGFVDINDRNIKLPSKGIVLNEGLAKSLGVTTGDKVIIKSFIPNRQDIDVEVKGIIKQALGSNGYMNINEMMTDLTDKEFITGVYLNSEDNVKSKLEDVKGIANIQSLEDMKNMFMEFLGLMIASVSVMVLFAGVLGFAIVYNSTVMSISERRLEFSSLRVMGFSKKDIFNIITKENALMTISGIILGIPLGQSMLNSLSSMFSTDIYTFEMMTTLNSFVIAIISTISFIVLAQLATLRKINKLDFMEALKNRIS